MPATQRADARGIRAIALFEAAKGGLAFIAALALLAIGPDALRRQLERALALLHVDRAGAPRASLLQAIDQDSLHLAAAAILAYALMRAIEAWGLWHRRLWASWLGCIGAALYLPFEFRALLAHPAWPTAALLAVNLVVVVVLARDIRRRTPAQAA